MHYSFYSDDPKKFLDVINSSGKVEIVPPGTLKAGIVTHHFLASAMMADFFKYINSAASPKTIILIGPDHYDKGIYPLSVSSLPWKTPFGMLNANKRITENIKNELSLKEDNEAFSGEHSIGILVPFIKYYFPKSEVVPILIRADAPKYYIDRLAKAISRDFGSSDTFIILSMDFSHDSDLKEAERRDDASKSAITRLKSKGIDKLRVDCPKGLYLLVSLLEKMDNIRVYFRDHSNSEAISKKKDLDNVTSYFTVLFLQAGLFK